MKNINGEERLKNVLCGDKKQNPEKMIKIVKAEVFQLLKNYFEIDGDGIDVKIKVENNQYDVNISFSSSCIRIANTF